MTLWNNKAFTENELSLFGKSVVILLLVVPVAFLTVRNILLARVAHPCAFLVCLLGLLLFLTAKISLFRKGVWISFGTRRLTEGMGNLYRLGYWLMAVGLACTFVE